MLVLLILNHMQLLFLLPTSANAVVADVLEAITIWIGPIEIRLTVDRFESIGWLVGVHPPRSDFPLLTRGTHRPVVFVGGAGGIFIWESGLFLYSFQNLGGWVDTLGSVALHLLWALLTLTTIL